MKRSFWLVGPLLLSLVACSPHFLTKEEPPAPTPIVSSAPDVFSVNPTSATINPIDILDVNVVFNPQNTKIYHDSLLIHSNDQNEPIAVAYLSGSGAPIVISSIPDKNSLSVTEFSNVSAKFNSQILDTTIQQTSFRVFGEISGRHSATISYESETQTAILDPENNRVEITI